LARVKEFDERIDRQERHGAPEREPPLDLHRFPVTTGLAGDANVPEALRLKPHGRQPSNRRNAA
jgi:hypothetical protein